MAEYEVQIDVTMSGSVFIDADSEKEAREKVKNMFANVTHSDLSSFHCINKEIIDAWKTEQLTRRSFSGEKLTPAENDYCSFCYHYEEFRAYGEV